MNINLAPIALPLLVGGAALFCSQQSASTQGLPTTALPTPQDLADDVARSSRIGRMLYELDHAAAVGTDVLFERVKDIQSKGLAGYVPLREGLPDGSPSGAWVVSFFTSETPARIAYTIRIAPGEKSELTEIAPPSPVNPDFAALIRARQTALAAMPKNGQPVNPIVLPGPPNGDSGILVYLLAGTKSPNVAVFGKHYLALVSDGGTTVTYMKPLSYSALELPTRASDGKTIAALFVTQLVTDYPLETHVFASLLHRLPVYVGTRRGVWRVEGDKITLVSDEPPKSFPGPEPAAPGKPQ